MRQITKTITVPIGGTTRTFRLRKLDALSGACLLRLLAREEISTGEEKNVNLMDRLFSSLSDEEMRSLMTRCLESVDVLLDAGYQPVMQLGEWSWSDLQYDPVNALALTMKEIVWSLEGFFVENESDSPSARPVS